MPGLLTISTIESQREISQAVQFAEQYPDGYGDAHHRPWLYEKMRPRLAAGDALGIMVHRAQTVAALGLVYAKLDTDGRLLVEQKLMRTATGFTDLGLGRVTLRLGLAIGALSAGAEPGTSALLYLDTRDPDTGHYFEHIGFEKGAAVELYTPGIVDQQYTLETVVPDIRHLVD